MSVEVINTIVKHADYLFEKRTAVTQLWQEIAENFYPERADFTVVRSTGADLAGNLVTSYPLLCRRELGDAFGAMLRPSAKEWFKARTRFNPKKTTTLGKQWLAWLSETARNLMYDTRSQFNRATKEADHDFATFGQACMSIEPNPQNDGLLFRCWHLRDVAWIEDATGAIGTVYRRWNPTASDVVALFPQTCSGKTREMLREKPYEEVKLLHAVMTASDYQRIDPTLNIIQPYVSMWIDIDNKIILEKVGRWTKHYIIPRWQTVSGSQYAHSPAVVAALPDGRLIQQISAVLLEAGEKAVSPPMVAVQEALRGDMSLFAGGVTYVDAAYDERLGEVLRPITQDKTGIQFGLELLRDLRGQLKEAFYLSKLNLPPVGGPEMTAYEVAQRIQEFIRNAIPLFEPMEMDYNGGLCDAVVTLAYHNIPEIRQSVPEEFQVHKFDYTFESPLRDAIEKVKVGQFMEAQQVIAAAMQADPTIAFLVDTMKATRDVLGAVVPADWMRTEGDVADYVKNQQAGVQSQQLLALMQQGANVAKTVKEATPTAGEGGKVL